MEVLESEIVDRESDEICVMRSSGSGYDPGKQLGCRLLSSSC